jgi:acetyl esterase/lipase
MEPDKPSERRYDTDYRDDLVSVCDRRIRPGRDPGGTGGVLRRGHDVEGFEKEMKAAGADFRIVSYPGALHRFTNPDADGYANKFNMPIGDNAVADAKSWAEI